MESKKGLALHWQIAIGLVLGVVAGALINQYWTDATWASIGVNDPAAYMAGKKPAEGAADPNESAGVAAGAVKFAAAFTDFLGKLFLRCLRFIAVPIVLFSLIVAVASLGDPRKLGRIGGKTIALFLFSGFTSSILGVTLARLFNPGGVISEADRANLPRVAADAAQRAGAGAKEYSGWRIVLDAIPENPFAAIATGQMLQIVVLSIVIGLGLTLIPAEKSRPVVAFLEGMAEAVLKLVQLLMRAAPVAVFALIAVIVGGLGLGVFKGLAIYCFVVLLGLAIILFVLYPGLTLLLTPASNKVGYRRFFWVAAPAQLFAVSSSSSAATLPVTMACARNRLGAEEGISSFVCSLGVSFNMDGTAMYQAVVVTFLAQLYGIDMSFADCATVALMAALLSIGVPGIPGGSLVVMAVVLDSIKVPPDGIAIILAVDRVLDMGRTVINVSGDLMGTAVVAASEGKLKTDAQARADLEAMEAA
ncbi:MAG TPA: dicarboxylate/amino acid:cation symporter [Phycisphaerales bacterium]|nr:dicarboxylate/amino acid:cation symporter [Phycisphaerales bacterium]